MTVHKSAAVGESQDACPTNEMTISLISNNQSNKREILDLLRRIRKPKQWKEDDKSFETKLSCKPASRLSVISLNNELDKQLVEKRSKADGICLIRRDLYSQIFDELIRQVCLVPQSKERGLMLIKVRDEYRMTLKSYEALLSNSVNIFAQDIITESQEIQTNLKTRIETVEVENRNLRKNLQQLETEYDQAEQTFKDFLLTLQHKHEKKMEELRRTNMQLTLHLDSMSSIDKKQEIAM